MAPEDASIVTLVVPPTEVDAALNEICCGVPGVSEKLAGMATTPLGRPLRETPIGPVKPLIGTAERVTWPGLPAAASVIAEGVREREKSGTSGPAGAALKARGSSRLFDNAPDVPASISVEDPGWALASGST
jgi:hypothetical protein